MLRSSGSAHAPSIQALGPRAPLLKAQDRTWHPWRALTEFRRNSEYLRANVQMWEHRRSSRANEALSPRHQNIWVKRENLPSITRTRRLCEHSWALAGISQFSSGWEPQPEQGVISIIMGPGESFDGTVFVLEHS